MATTKVRGELVDLNESTSESGLKMPSGTELNRPTAAAGQIRNNTNETSESSASCMEYYNGSAWKRINNVTPPPAAFSYKAVLYTGDDSTGRAITGTGFKPDFVWIKPINQVENHNIYDTSRGPTKQLIPNNTSASATQPNTVQSFDADGFTLNNDNNVNKSGINYVAWCMTANGGTTSSNGDGGITSTVQASEGMSIVEWTGTGSTSQTVGHGLGAVPELIITKRTDGTNDWYTWHKDLNSGTNSADYFLKLNSSDGETLNTGTPPSIWAGTEPTSTVFSVGSTLDSSSDTFIAYCFTSVTGKIATGAYTGDGNSTGPTISTGFEPNFLLVHRLDTGDGWRILDSVRSTSNPRNDYLDANLTAAEGTSVFSNVDFNSTDFQLMNLGSTYNNSGGRYMYLALN